MKDTVFAAVLVGVGVFALVWIMRTPGGFGAPAGGIGFATVPIICSVLLIGLSAIYLIGSLLRLVLALMQGEEPLAAVRGWRPSAVTWQRLATVAGLVAYAFALRYLPFFMATALLLAAMFVVYGRRRPFPVVVVALLGSAALTGLFVYVLRLPI